jgi:copper chaperone
MSTTIKVTGMTCMHCVGAVKRALEQLPGVDSAEVTLEPGQAVVEGSADGDAMLAAIKEEGYEGELQ